MTCAYLCVCYILFLFVFYVNNNMLPHHLAPCLFPITIHLEDRLFFHNAFRFTSFFLMASFVFHRHVSSRLLFDVHFKHSQFFGRYTITAVKQVCMHIGPCANVSFGQIPKRGISK